MSLLKVQLLKGRCAIRTTPELQTIELDTKEHGTLKYHRNELSSDENFRNTFNRFYNQRGKSIIVQQTEPDTISATFYVHFNQIA